MVGFALIVHLHALSHTRAHTQLNGWTHHRACDNRVSARVKCSYWSAAISSLIWTWMQGTRCNWTCCTFRWAPAASIPRVVRHAHMVNHFELERLVNRFCIFYLPTVKGCHFEKYSPRFTGRSYPTGCYSMPGAIRRLLPRALQTSVFRVSPWRHPHTHTHKHFLLLYI